MMRYTTYKVRLAGIPKIALTVMHELVAYTEHTTRITLHKLSFEKFLTIANLSQTTTWADVVQIMSHCGKAVASARQYEHVGTGIKEVLYGSWPVFRNISITAEEVIFEICPLRWEGNIKDF
jgi:hypothetical protein